MLKKVINLGLLSMLAFSNLFSVETPSLLERMHIDDDEFRVDSAHDAFYIHVGNNVWLVTNSVHRDDTGLFSYERDLRKSSGSDLTMEYEKKWKCPYCYQYWPLGKSCGNSNCPSKYKN